MSTIPTSSDSILILLKNTLEFNASVVALCTLYVGSTDNMKAQRKFIREYERTAKLYRETQDNLVKEIYKDLIKNEQKVQRHKTD